MTEVKNNEIKNIVRQFLLKNPQLIENAKINDQIINHVINTGADILSNNWGLNNNPSGFAKAIVSDKLTDTYAKADDVNEQFIKFYVNLKYNVGKPNNI